MSTNDRSEGPNLTLEQGAAARRYAKAYERFQTATSGHRRTVAAEDLKLSRAALSPQQVAIMDMAVGKGRDIAILAQQTGRSAADLSKILVQACEALAAQFVGAA